MTQKKKTADLTSSTVDEPALSDSEALSILLDTERTRDLSARELVEKGRLIQLSDGVGFELNDAPAAFKMALGLDPEYVPAILEIGWFTLNVEDDAASASPYFEEGICILDRLLREAKDGLQKCTAELKVDNST
jgi:hypothetical protein